jgi:hypothetical protein
VTPKKNEISALISRFVMEKDPSTSKHILAVLPDHSTAEVSYEI